MNLTLDQVACRRGGRLLFEDLSLALGAGDAAVVTGANGSGKSSLIRLSAGLLAPSAGKVAREGGTALLGEASALDPERTLAAALGFWARIDGRPNAMTHALERVGLAAVADVPVRWLSTGQRRRAGLARVLVQDAGIWLLDEPANGLDAASVAMLESLVEAHRSAGGVAVIATHLPLAITGGREVRL